SFEVKEVFKFPLLLEWQQKNKDFVLNDLLRFINWGKVSAGDYATYIRPTGILNDEDYFQWFMEYTSNEFSLKDFAAKLLEKYAEQQLKTKKNDVCNDNSKNVSQTGYVLYPPCSASSKTTKNQFSWPKKGSIGSEATEIKTRLRASTKNIAQAEVSPAYTVQFTSANESTTLECRYCRQLFADKFRLLRHEKDYHVNKISLSQENETNGSSSNNSGNVAVNKATNFNSSRKAVASNLKIALKSDDNEDECDKSTEGVNEVPNIYTNICLNGRITDHVVNRKVKFNVVQTKYKVSRTASIWNCEPANKNVLIFMRSGERIFACKVCHKEFPNLSRTRMHVATVHLHRKNFKCGICGKMYTNKPNLLIHIEAIHGDNVRRYECDICGEKFMTKHYRYCHKRRQHV
ncbi:zinc finger protein 260-like protein, partial [Leptotrombidium deliense]